MWRRYDVSYPVAVLLVLCIEVAIVFGDLRWLVGSVALVIIAAIAMVREAR